MKPVQYIGRALARAASTLLNAAIVIVMGGSIVAMANYAVTVGSGTNFGSIVVSTVHYAQQLVCDYVTPSQCANVTASGEVKVIGTGVADGSTSSGQTSSKIACNDTSTTATYTTAQTNPCVATLNGGILVAPYSLPDSLVSGLTTAMTGTTSTSLIAAPSGSLHNYITHLICTNSHATVGTFVVVQDGSGGTTFYEGYAAAVGGGFSITFPAPLRQPTAATAVFVADVTTGANVICAGSGFKAL